MTLVWTLIVFLHILAATFWVGGQLMLVIVIMPLLRRTAHPEIVGEMAKRSGRRFAKVANFGLFPILVTTGILLAWHDGVRLRNLNSTSFGHALETKVILVAVVLALAAGHGVAARRFSRRGARTLALVTAVLSVAILGLAAALSVLPSP